MRSTFVHSAILLAAIAGHLKRANALKTVFAYPPDVESDNDGNFSLSQPEDSHKGEEPILIIPFTAAAVVAVVGLLATVGIVAIIRYNRNTGRVTARSIINQRQTKKAEVQLDKKDLERPPLVPPRTPNMHSLVNTDSSSSSASTRSTTVSDRLTPQSFDGVDSSTWDGNVTVHFEFPTSSSTDLDAISCSSEPPPVPPWTTAASVLAMESKREGDLRAEMATVTGGVQRERDVLEPVAVDNLLPPRNIPRLKLDATLSDPSGCMKEYLQPTVVMNRNPAYRLHSLH